MSARSLTMPSPPDYNRAALRLNLNCNAGWMVHAMVPGSLLTDEDCDATARQERAADDVGPARDAGARIGDRGRGPWSDGGPEGCRGLGRRPDAGGLLAVGQPGGGLPGTGKAGARLES